MPNGSFAVGAEKGLEVSWTLAAAILLGSLGGSDGGGRILAGVD